MINKERLKEIISECHIKKSCYLTDETKDQLTNDIIKELEESNIENKNCKFFDRDKMVGAGFIYAKEANLNIRGVLKNELSDVYFSGWMDSYDYHKVNKRPYTTNQFNI